MFFGSERGHQLSTYEKMRAATYRGKDYHALCVCTRLHYLFPCVSFFCKEIDFFECLYFNEF